MFWPVLSGEPPAGPVDPRTTSFTGSTVGSPVRILAPWAMASRLRTAVAPI